LLRILKFLTKIYNIYIIYLQTKRISNQIEIEMRTYNDIKKQIQNICTLEWDKIWKKQNQKLSEIKKSNFKWPSNNQNRKNKTG